MFEYASFVVRNPSYVTANARKQWSVRKALLAHRKNNPVCAATGKTKGLEVHHIIPVSVRADLAGVASNMITLERRAHLHDGHAGNYKSYVANLLEVIATRRIQRTIGA